MLAIIHITLMSMQWRCYAQTFNAWTFHKLWSGNQYFWLRSLASTSVSQIVLFCSVMIFRVLTSKNTLNLTYKRLIFLTHPLKFAFV